MNEKTDVYKFFYIDILKYKDVGIFCTKQIDEPCAIYIHIYYIQFYTTGTLMSDDKLDKNILCQNRKQNLKSLFF